MLRRWISDRWRTPPWIWVELFVLVSVPSLLDETQWRTRIRWFFDLLEKIPYTLTSKTTSLSLVTSHHEFCGRPSTNPSDMWDSSRRTETSTIWLGLIIPVAGETWYNSKKQLSFCYSQYHCPINNDNVQFRECKTQADKIISRWLM